MHDALHVERADVAEAATHEVSDAISEQLTAWRAQGVDKRDPARFHRIEALARRSRAYTGDVRRVLDERLKALVDDLTQALGSASTVSAGEACGASGASEVIGADETDTDDQTAQLAASPLATLTADIVQRGRTSERPALSAGARKTPAAAAAPTRQTQRTREAAQPEGVCAPPVKRPIAPSAPPAPMPVTVTPTVITTDDAFEDLDVLEYFRETWSKLSTDGNLRQSLAQVPENAGPLNSSHLVHRALSLMHDVSPDYLRHFLRHADALSWLEDMETTGVLGNKPAARAATVAKPSRAKAR